MVEQTRWRPPHGTVGKPSLVHSIAFGASYPDHRELG